MCFISIKKIKKKKINLKARINSIFLDHKGSYTVEAAFIIPISLFLVMSFITIAFSLYNRCSIERAVCVSALRASEQIFKNSQQKNTEAGQAIQDVLAYNLLFENEIQKDISIKGNTINVSMSTSEKTGEFTTKAKKKAVDPVLFVRTCRKIKGGLSQYDAGGIQEGRP